MGCAIIGKNIMRLIPIIKWILFSIIFFTSIVLPLIFLETPLSAYADAALAWAGTNKVAVSLIVITALMADVILPVPNGLTNTLSGMSLGWGLSSIVVWIGLNLGACIGYFLGRMAARPIAKKIISNDEFNDAEKALKNFNALGLILSRPVPGFAELIVISAGLSKMPFKNFISVVSITNLGVAIVFSGIGAAAIGSNSSFLAFTGAAVLPALCYFFYNKFYKT